MKKVLFGFLALILCGQVSFAQPVSDQAIIPVGITVQSIMRLNVLSGGNIEFVFSRISDLSAGIANSTAYDTQCTVSASQNWDLVLGTDAVSFTSETGATINLNVVDLWVTTGGTLVYGTDINSPYYGNATPGAPLDAGPQDLLARIAAPGSNIGDATDNIFTIHWQCGVTNDLASLSPAPGRYSVNVYLSLELATN